MYKILLFIAFILIAVVPVFGAIEVRDSTKLPQCDTIIQISGVALPVRIKKVNNDFITYTQCGENSTNVYKIERSKVKELKSKKFSSEPRKELPLTTQATRASKRVLISALALAASLFFVAASLDGEGGNGGVFMVFLISLLISPFIFLASIIKCFALIKKAKKAGDKTAINQASSGIIVALIAILVFFRIYSKFS